MKVGILSDTHFGFAWGTPREEESFEQAAEGLKKLLEEKVDIIILAGDVFHVPAPPPEIWSRAIDVLSLAKTRDSHVTADVPARCLEGTPIVCIHGTHERRARKAETALQTLEKVGLVIHLHAGSVTFSKSEDQLTIHGLSGVPEKYASSAIKQWSPEPAPGANILVFHQNLFPFIYTSSNDGLHLADLPEGFDLYVDGHIHTPILTNYGEAPVIITGSTVLTQMRKGEQGDKCVWTWDGKIKQIPIKTRKFVYLELSAEGRTPLELEKQMESVLSGYGKDTLVKLKVTGKLKPGYTSGDITVPRVPALVSIDRSLDTGKSDPEVRPLDETAVSLLSAKLAELGFKSRTDVSVLYELLVSGNLDAAAKLLEDSA